MNGDKYSQQIVDGMKVIVCKVKDNPLGYTSVAYPVDELRLPKWFQDLPFDHSEMEATIKTMKNHQDELRQLMAETGNVEIKQHHSQIGQ